MFKRKSKIDDIKILTDDIVTCNGFHILAADTVEGFMVVNPVSKYHVYQTTMDNALVYARAQKNPLEV